MPKKSSDRTDRRSRDADRALEPQDILFTRRETAKILKTSEPTLERWASLGIGPRPVKVGPRAVRYTLAELRRCREPI